MIEHTKTGTMFTGSGVPLFRMIAQLSALKFKVKTGMNLGRGGSIVNMVKREYNLKGNAAKVLELFAPIVEAAKSKELHAVELDNVGKVKPLPLKEKPGHVFWPVEPRGAGWVLGLVKPDEKGFYPTGRFVEGTMKEAEHYCVKEAAARGINEDQHTAAVGSTMFRTGYFHQLTSALAHKAKTKKGGRRGTNRAN